jgi:hypothetical protein
MTTIRVNLGDRSYDIAIRSGDSGGLGPFARQRCRGSVACVVTDENVAPLSWPDALASFLAFYNLFLLKNAQCCDAVRVMNEVAGEDRLFQVVDFSDEVRTWAASQSAQPLPTYRKMVTA